MISIDPPCLKYRETIPKGLIAQLQSFYIFGNDAQQFRKKHNLYPTKGPFRTRVVAFVFSIIHLYEKDSCNCDSGEFACFAKFGMVFAQVKLA